MIICKQHYYNSTTVTIGEEIYCSYTPPIYLSDIPDTEENSPNKYPLNNDDVSLTYKKEKEEEHNLGSVQKFPPPNCS